MKSSVRWTSWTRCSAARVRPLGAGVARLQAAASATVLSGRRGVQRKSIQSKRRNGTTFQILGAPSKSADERVVSLTFASWNQIGEWLRGLEAFQQAA